MAEALALTSFKTGALFSPCKRYRYRLWRQWGVVKPVLFVMLNPSTADETRDDPTIRRCISFAKRWGYGGVEIANLYAYRATNPRDMEAAANAGVDVEGPENIRRINYVAADAGLIVIAWGVHAKERDARAMVDGLRKHEQVYCLGTTKSGAPRHPLYVHGDTTPQVFEWPAAGCV